MPEITIINPYSENKDIVKVSNGINLLRILLDNNYDLNTYCGGKGLCGKCKIKIKSGQIPAKSQERKLLTSNEIKNNIRLACLIDVEKNLTIELKQSSDIIALTSGLIPEFEYNPLINKKSLTLSEPDLNDQRDYLQRIYDKTNTNKFTLKTLKKLNNLNKNETFTIITKNKSIIGIEKGNTENKCYGLAIDIGTTTIAIYLIDLYKKQTIDNISLYNPQKKYGADIISRINFTEEEDKGTDILKKQLIQGINQGIKNLIKDNKIIRENIYISTIVGNTIMLHTFLGIDTSSIAKSPYIPLFTDYIDLKPKEINLKINPEGIIQILPSISGYIGADIMADMLSVNFNENTNNNDLLIDIGTNGEIVLNTENYIYACSTAAGPAFEGASISSGIAGINGAISEFKISEKGRITYKTINNVEPKGICGSGLLDIVAQLYKHNIIDQNGTFASKKNLKSTYQNLLVNYNDMKAFKIVDKKNSGTDDDILITQKDIREVQLAKGAIQAGINILIKEVNINYSDIDNVYIAGGFGNYLDPHHACTINLIPEELEEKIIQIGNGAGAGAQLYLFNKKYKNHVKKIKEKVKYIELSSRQDFQNEFMGSMQF